MVLIRSIEQSETIIITQELETVKNTIVFDIESVTIEHPKLLQNYHGP